MTKYNAKILVTGGGSGVGQSIIKALRLANKNLKRNYKIFTADINSFAPGLYRGDKGFIVPPAKKPNYINSLIKLCKKNKIEIIIPGSDPELPILAKNKTSLLKEKIVTVVSNYNAIKIGLDKWETYKFLKGNNLPYAFSSLPKNIDNLLQKTNFPVLIKPRMGSGSIGVNIVNNKEELKFYIKRTKNPIIQELLSSGDKEYTSGILFSKKGEFIDSITLKRYLKKGASYRAIIKNFLKVRKAAEKVAIATDLIGPVNIQMRISQKRPITFEINPRFSGTTTVRAFVGFNGPDAIIRNFLYGEKINKMNYKKNITMMRYLNEMYVSEKNLKNLKKNLTTHKCGKVFQEF